ncbi:Intersectin-2 [Clydaea vesicula]|uniref:Intersectin-2 n=1 Tax=Clydaea vesicula TaxID=447962 RepID=A0AAD5U1Q8_9FUNG|nr:Intersectin-2 [Clydaea vesicula]
MNPLSFIDAADLEQYSQFFNDNRNQNGRISAEAASKILKLSNLPQDVLGHIWSLSSLSNAPSLSQPEFFLAMYLTKVRTNGTQLPSQLPDHIRNAVVTAMNMTQSSIAVSQNAPMQFQHSGSKSSSTHPGFTPRGISPHHQIQPTRSNTGWAIDANEKAGYDAVFKVWDPTNTGFINGDRAINIFSQSGLHENILAHIWNLADTHSHGKLNADEFAVAMHLVHKKLSGADLPQTLPPELIPPSTRDLNEMASLMKNQVINDLINKPKKQALFQSIVNANDSFTSSLGNNSSFASSTATAEADRALEEAKKAEIIELIEKRKKVLLSLKPQLEESKKAVKDSEAVISRIKRETIDLNAEVVLTITQKNQALSANFSNSSTFGDESKKYFLEAQDVFKQLTELNEECNVLENELANKKSELARKKQQKSGGGITASASGRNLSSLLSGNIAGGSDPVANKAAAQRMAALGVGSGQLSPLANITTELSNIESEKNQNCKKLKENYERSKSIYENFKRSFYGGTDHRVAQLATEFWEPSTDEKLKFNDGVGFLSPEGITVRGLILDMKESIPKPFVAPRTLDTSTYQSHASSYSGFENSSIAFAAKPPNYGYNENLQPSSLVNPYSNIPAQSRLPDLGSYQQPGISFRKDSPESLGTKNFSDVQATENYLTKQKDAEKLHMGEDSIQNPYARKSNFDYPEETRNFKPSGLYQDFLQNTPVSQQISAYNTSANNNHISKHSKESGYESIQSNTAFTAKNQPKAQENFLAKTSKDFEEKKDPDFSRNDHLSTTEAKNSFLSDTAAVNSYSLISPAAASDQTFPFATSHNSVDTAKSKKIEDVEQLSTSKNYPYSPYNSNIAALPISSSNPSTNPFSFKNNIADFPNKSFFTEPLLNDDNKSSVSAKSSTKLINSQPLSENAFGNIAGILKNNSEIASLNNSSPDSLLANNGSQKYLSTTSSPKDLPSTDSVLPPSIPSIESPNSAPPPPPPPPPPPAGFVVPIPASDTKAMTSTTAKPVIIPSSGLGVDILESIRNAGGPSGLKKASLRKVNASVVVPSKKAFQNTSKIPGPSSKDSNYVVTSQKISQTLSSTLSNVGNVSDKMKNLQGAISSVFGHSEPTSSAPLVTTTNTQSSAPPEGVKFAISEEPEKSLGSNFVHVETPTSTGTQNSTDWVKVEDEHDEKKSEAITEVILFVVQAAYDFESERPDDLTFKVGELINVLKEHDDWLFGNKVGNDTGGWFPKAYVKNKEVEELQFNPESPFESSGLVDSLKVAEVLYDYEMKRDDEVTILAGEKVSIIEKIDTNWWQVKNSRGIGFVPSSFLREVESNIETGNASEKSNEIDWFADTSAPDKAVQFNLKPETGSGNFDFNNSASMKGSENSIPRSESFRPANSLSIYHQPWSALISPEILQTIPLQERKRQEAIFELCGTEQSYVQDLQLMIELFFKPMQQIMSKGDINYLFQNIEEILTTNSMILSDLESAQQSQNYYIQRIGKIFLRHVQNLEYYTTFCGSLSSIIAFLQTKRQSDKKLQNFLKETQANPRCRNLDLSSFLLLPMQRHIDHDEVAQSLELANATADLINTAAQAQESREKLEEISSIVDFSSLNNPNFSLIGATKYLGQRKIIYEGDLLKMKSGKRLRCFLFNDMILLCEKKGSTNSFKLYKTVC